MAYDEDLADQVRELVQGQAGVTEKKMFGGLAFLINGHLAVAVSGKGGLLVRTDPARTAALMEQPHTGPMEMRGREMDGWLRVAPAGVSDPADLDRWVTGGVTYARTLPPKT